MLEKGKKAISIDDTVRMYMEQADYLQRMTSEIYNMLQEQKLRLEELEKQHKEASYAQACFEEKSINEIIFKYLRYYDIARIDVKNCGELINNLEFLSISNEVKVTQPKWFLNEQGKGYVLETKERALKFCVKCYAKGILSIWLRGMDVVLSGKNKLNLGIVYQYLRVNGKDVFSEAHTVCHDIPYHYTQEVNDDDVVDIELAWAPQNISL